MLFEQLLRLYSYNLMLILWLQNKYHNIVVTELGETFSVNLDFVPKNFSLIGFPVLKLEKTVQWENLSLSYDNQQSSLVNDNFHFAYRTSRLTPQLGIGVEKENDLLYFIESEMKEIDFFEDWIIRNINSSELKYSVDIQHHQSESLHQNNVS